MNDMKKPVAVPEIGIEPDAELIAICAEHVKNIDASTASTFQGEFEDDPLWHAYERTRDAIDDAKPTTIVGIVAKARAAKAEALQPDGSEHPSNCPAEGFAWDIVNDLLRLDAIPNPDAELIRLCGEYRDIELAWRGAFNRFPDTRPGDRDRELFQAPLRARQDEIAEALEEIPPARTLAGFQALARTLPLSAGEMFDGPEHFTDTEFWLAEKLIRDLTEARA